VTTLDLVRQLQTLDTNIDEARERVSTIEAMLANRSEYESARRQHSALATEQKRLESEQRDLELQAADIRQHLADGEQRLYSGKIASPRELDDLKRKGDELRRQVSTFDERMLGLMEQIESATAATTQSEQRLRQIVADRRTLEAALIGERKTLTGDLRSWQSERDTVRPQIDAQTLRLYDRLRSTREGLAVAEVRQRTCQGCRVSMTAAAEQRLRHGEGIITCQSCGRILYLAG